MTKFVAALAALLLAAPAFAQQAMPMSPSETIDTLSMKIQILQQNLDTALIQVARNGAAFEAQKATLIEWLKTAQAAEAAAKPKPPSK